MSYMGVHSDAITYLVHMSAYAQLAMS